jgi:PAS domain S-box-containing protein
MAKKPSYEELQQRVRELDSTVRKLTKKMLQESQARYRSLFKNNHAVMLLIDPENAAIVDANPAAISFYGWSHEELRAKKITDLNTLSNQHVFQEMRRAKKEQRRHFLFRHHVSNGEIRDVEVYSGPVTINGKELLYSIIHDITERKRAEQALLQEKNKLQEALAKIKTLSGLLPICASCKKIRDDKGYWNQIEIYIRKNSQAEFSHSLCPHCAKQLYPFLESHPDS